MGRPTYSILNYIILRQKTLDSRAPHPHFVGSLNYIDQNSGFKPQKHAMGGFAAQQESSMFLATPTLNYFRDAIKEQYYPVRSYEDK